jgi:phosphoribosyl 1,2-cyclic phosphodiesterase
MPRGQAPRRKPGARTPRPARPQLLVRFWGTRGSIATPGPGTEKYGGNTPCVSVQCDDTLIVLDAGTGIRNLGMELVREATAHGRPINAHVLLSHTHWDHIQGLPFFEPAYRPGVTLRIYGSHKKERFLASILHGQMNVNYFPVSMDQLAAKVSITELTQNPLRIGPVTVEWEEQVFHPGGSVRYAIMAGGRRVVYSTDVELDRMFSGETGGQSRKFARQYERFVRGADLLIADGQYTALEYADRIGRGHTSIPLLLEVAARAGVRRLAVFHHEPDHTDGILNSFCARYRPRCATGNGLGSVFWAREGMRVAV